MICPQRTEYALDRLLDYSAGRLHGAEREAMAAHLGGCADCVAFVSGQSALWSALDEWEPEPVSARFNRRLWQRIEESRRIPWYRQFASWKPAFSLAAASAVILAGFLLDHKHAVKIPAGAAVSSAEADQAEATLDDLQLLRQFDSAEVRPM